jgi:hypothetical protein
MLVLRFQFLIFSPLTSTNIASEVGKKWSYQSKKEVKITVTMIKVYHFIYSLPYLQGTELQKWGKKWSYQVKRR